MKKKLNQNRLQKEVNKVTPNVPLQVQNDNQQDRQTQVSQQQFYEHQEDQVSHSYPPQINTNFNPHNLHNIAYDPQQHSENYINLSAPIYHQQRVQQNFV